MGNNFSLGSEKFNIELKPIYFLGTLLSATLPLYNLSGSGWLQTELKNNRSNYYSYLSTIKKKTDIFDTCVLVSLIAVVVGIYFVKKSTSSKNFWGN